MNKCIAKISRCGIAIVSMLHGYSKQRRMIAPSKQYLGFLFYDDRVASCTYVSFHCLHFSFQ